MPQPQNKPLNAKSSKQSSNRALSTQQETFWVHLSIVSALTSWLPGLRDNVHGCAVFPHNGHGHIVFFRTDHKKPVFLDVTEHLHPFLEDAQADSKSKHQRFAPLAAYLYRWIGQLESQYQPDALTSLHKNLPMHFPAVCHSAPMNKSYEKKHIDGFLLPRSLCVSFLEHHQIDYLTPQSPIYTLLQQLHENKAFSKFKDLTSQWERILLERQTPQSDTAITPPIRSL